MKKILVISAVMMLAFLNILSARMIDVSKYSGKQDHFVNFKDVKEMYTEGKNCAVYFYSDLKSISGNKMVVKNLTCKSFKEKIKASMPHHRENREEGAKKRHHGE